MSIARLIYFFHQYRFFLFESHSIIISKQEESKSKVLFCLYVNNCKVYVWRFDISYVMSIFNRFSFLINAFSMKDRRRHVLCSFVTQKRYFFKKKRKINWLQSTIDSNVKKLKFKFVQSQKWNIHKIVKKLLKQIRWWIKLHFKLSHVSSRIYQHMQSKN